MLFLERKLVLGPQVVPHRGHNLPPLLRTMTKHNLIHVGFTYSACDFCPILTQFESRPQILIKIPPPKYKISQ
jgi:hypothetical protein